MPATAVMEGAAVEDFRGSMAGMNGNYLAAIKALARSFELAMQTGQIRRAITLATNHGSHLHPDKPTTRPPWSGSSVASIWPAPRSGPA